LTQRKGRTLLQTKKDYVRDNKVLEQVSSINQRKFLGKFKEIEFYPGDGQPPMKRPKTVSAGRRRRL